MASSTGDEIDYEITGDYVQDSYSQLLSRSRKLNNIIRSGNSEIQKSYNEAVIFVTGGTGFLGKQLIEKLLRTNRSVKKIYVLMRSKKGQSVIERLSLMLEDVIFDEAKKIHSNILSKICPIEGDITELLMGIGEQDWKILVDEVNYIFHVAATIRFNEPLTKAVLTNLRGTREVVNLALSCSQLRAMVHVSTAFVHCYMKDVEERFYDCPLSPQTVIEMAERYDEKKLDEITPTIIGDWPNTYTFTKALAELLIKDMAKDLPVCIVRPAIVLPTVFEPTPAWMDKSNIFGPSGLLYGCVLGGVHVFLMDKASRLDIVPVDIVNNLTIASAFTVQKTKRKDDEEIPIYTLSSYRNSTTFGDLFNFLTIEGRDCPSPKALYYGCGFMTKNKYIYLIATIFYHLIPGLFADALLMLVGQKTRATRLYKLLYTMNSSMEHFVCNDWNNYDTNTMSLYQNLSNDDKVMFNFDIASVNMYEFLKTWGLGVRKYLVKDGLKDNEYARRKQKWLRVLHYTLIIIYLYLLWKVLSLGYFLVECVTDFFLYH